MLLGCYHTSFHNIQCGRSLLSADSVHPKYSFPRCQTRMLWTSLSLEVLVIFHFLFHCLAMLPAPDIHSCITPLSKAELLYYHQ